MKYATVLGLGSIALAALAVQARLNPLLLWFSFDLAVVAVGYAGLGPRVFGKNPGGTLAPLAGLVLAPYLLMTFIVWHLSRLLRREPPFHRLTEGFLIGRRLLPAELPAEVATVVDLTAEFPEPGPVRNGRIYRAFPILDGSAPEVGTMRDLAREILQLPGEVYIHCAEGHGRTALVAASVLLVRGDATSAKQALDCVSQQRPGARVNRAQRRALESLAVALR